MSIASITTFGFGSFSTINLAVTLGYGQGAAVNTGDTHDGFTRKDYEGYLKKLKAKERALARLREEKVEERRSLKDQLQSLANPKDAALTPTPKEQKQLAPVVLAKIDNLEKEILEIYNLMAQYHAEQQRLQRHRDEEAILMLI